jgi:Exostosin family
MSQMKLRIFSDRSYLQPGDRHVTMLYPFWGKNPEDPGAPTTGRYDRYVGIGSGVFEMTTLEKADVAVLPAAWEQVSGNRAATERAEQFLDLARRAHKPTVIFFWSDSDEEVPYDNTVVFRTSCYRSRRRRNEFAMPAWSEDFVAKYLGGQLSVRAKGVKAVVGFCGYAPGFNVGPRTGRQRPTQAIRAWAKRLATALGSRKTDASIRTTVLRYLATCPLIETNFKVRTHFLGGALLPDGGVDVQKMQRLREEYVQNTVESDYVLCARGGGNFSYRLYETLNCGRIPVFVDTDCVLPYQSEITWREYCVWVDERDVKMAGEKVALFHASLSEREFIEIQRECRRLWESHLSPEGFFANFYKHFQ